MWSTRRVYKEALSEAVEAFSDKRDGAAVFRAELLNISPAMFKNSLIESNRKSWFKI